MVLLGGTLPSSSSLIFLPIPSPFAVPVFGISDTDSKSVPPLHAVTDMVTHIQLPLQDLVPQTAPAHLFSCP